MPYMIAVSLEMSDEPNKINCCHCQAVFCQTRAQNYS